jgi:thiamine monophosphate synthase
MNKLFYKHYVFLEKITDQIKTSLLKFKNINIIINIDSTDLQSLKNEFAIIRFAKKNQIPLLFKNDFRRCIKYDGDGVFIESKNKKLIRPILLKKKILIIGSVHNQIEYFVKLKQNCRVIMLSPIFLNPKYSKNKILDVIKYNLISLNWKIITCALGGINFKNYRKIECTKSNQVGFIRAIKNPSAHSADG